MTLRSFYDVAPDISKNVPMLIGNVSEEGNRMNSRPTEEEWHATLARTWGEPKATELIAAMKKKYPEKSIRLLSYGVNGISSRNNVQRMVKLKHEQKAAPYYFTWQSPMLEDAGAWHTSELAFVSITRALRTGDGQYAGGPGSCKEDGDSVGEFRGHRQPQPAEVNVDPERSDPLPDHGVRQSLPHGGRS